MNLLYLLQEQNPSFQVEGINSMIWNEAFSNYVTFIAGVVVGTLGWFINSFLSRKRPQIIQVIRKEQVSLLKVDSQVERDIKLEYRGNSINSLYRTALDLYNRGEEPIQNFTITIQTDSEDVQGEVLEKIVMDSNDNEVQGARHILERKNRVML